MTGNHQEAKQVQPQNGQILIRTRGIWLRELKRGLPAYPQAGRQAVEGQTLHRDREGYIYLAH